jgi:hypothetical protein
MNIKIVAMCWIKGKEDAHERVELDQEAIMDVLRGATPSIFKTPVNQQYHWELCQVTFE